MPKALHSPWSSGQFRLLTEQALSASTGVSYVLPSGLEEVRLVLVGSGGAVAGSPVQLTFNGDSSSANYEFATGYALLGAAATFGGQGSASLGFIQLAIVAAAVTALRVDATFGVSKANGPQGCLGSFYARAAGANNSNRGNTGGMWVPAAADVANFTITFGAAFTGKLRVYGMS